MWALFNSQEEFDTWHNALKVALNYPLNDGITTDYTKLLPQSDGRLVAWVDAEYAEGLEETNPPLPSIR